MKSGNRFMKGQIAVIMTLVLVTLLGAMALGTDVGILYYNWVQLQKAADAGALAGATKLDAVQNDSSNAQLASQYADGYACLNGINASANNSAAVCPNPVNNPSYVDQILFTNVNSANTQVSIGLQRQVPYYFARLLGLTNGQVAAKATAKVNPSGTCHIFPAIINCKGNCTSYTAEFGTAENFGVKFSEPLSASTAPGNWGWVDVGQGQGGNQLKNAISGGYSSDVTVGQTINTVTGGKDGPITQGWNALLAEHNAVSTTDPSTVCNGSNPSPESVAGDPLAVIVPVADMSVCTTGNCNVTISGFAEVYLTGLTATGSASRATITGCFISMVTPSCTGSATATNFGSLGKPILIQ